MYKYKYFLLLLFIISCSVSQGIKNNNESQILIYQHERSTLRDYYLFLFKNEKDSLFYILSPKSDTKKIQNCKELIVNNKYLLTLEIIKPSLIIKSGLRGGRTLEISLMDNSGDYIIYNDTLIVPMYSSPNIIENCYIADIDSVKH